MVLLIMNAMLGLKMNSLLLFVLFNIRLRQELILVCLELVSHF